MPQGLNAWMTFRSLKKLRTKQSQEGANGSVWMPQWLKFQNYIQKFEKNWGKKMAKQAENISVWMPQGLKWLNDIQ